MLRICHVIPLPTASAPRAFFVDVLSSFLTSAKFTRYELSETVGPVCEAETTAALHDPATHALELAHALAFRNGLGNSIFATPGHHVSADDVKAFAQSVFGAGNVAVLGTGISPAALEKLVEKSLGSLSSAVSPSASASSYYGGETRVDAHGAPEVEQSGLGGAEDVHDGHRRAEAADVRGERGGEGEDGPEQRAERDREEGGHEQQVAVGLRAARVVGQPDVVGRAAGVGDVLDLSCEV